MTNTIYQWAIVGAGPAGIAAVGKLLDKGIPPKQILWCDPHFQVGDLGQYWSNVSSNTKVKLFTHFLHDCPSFAYADIASNFALPNLDQEKTCILKYMVEPLQEITNQLMRKVETNYSIIETLALRERCWFLSCESTVFQAQNVILATGALPSRLNYPNLDVIPLEIAIDKEKLMQEINIQDSYAVFGSSHSAIMILSYLVEMGVKEVINFYRSPCRYAVEINNSILFDNTGLKGKTAEWARANIDGVLPSNLSRYKATEENLTRFLPHCKKVIYAVGFEKRKNIYIKDYEDLEHNPHVGIIGPGLFGFGIAYPEVKIDPFGNSETQVGLWKFMTYLNKVLPIWLEYHS